MDSSLLIHTTAGFLVVALTAYVVMGGADFGGGILEASLGANRHREVRQRLQAVLAPIWEANHVWLIAVVVIAFVGFPRFYSTALTRLYVPTSFALLAIILRGVFFTLRKYDPTPGRWAWLYSVLFRMSSTLAPLWFGLFLGGLFSTHPGSPNEPPAGSFVSVYVEPWLHPFGLLIGAFVASLFAYLAAVFFVGELSDERQRLLIRGRALAFFVATFLLGGMVLVSGATSGRVPWSAAWSPTFVVCQVAATGGIGAVHWGFVKHWPWLSRLGAGAQVLAILVGWLSVQYPTMLRMETESLTLSAAAAPPVTLLWLVIGLVVVLALVLPLLFVLFRVFRQSAAVES